VCFLPVVMASECYWFDQQRKAKEKKKGHFCEYIQQKAFILESALAAGRQAGRRAGRQAGR